MADTVGGGPRHLDPTRFGYHDKERKWVPFKVTVGKLVYSCGHTGKVVVGQAPKKGEEEVRTFLGKVAERVCPKCLPTAGRLRYQSQDKGKD